ncbi:MAG: bifunctional (p)ppGpp synthetase/guanosine-3',5'-bis(diphosphate) 3'-pyrophosphohydrolase [Anaerolineae bacterium]|nr:bifunctional (p)ppGpp synthetase/guanosine-3',5'-bis(diphosphate) 3'-pyrophosphohydrolase [Anaerolineae bacterium]MDK1081445.1 bifunctional (p)ppGpp synthetase/guanosine-3',5'-bis(diphosphate) 3'-pyrophosphohydrolase [Anaerolineae bacterium]MDK1117902.1 bifunctional (p)ppGpp synthetase/guanosine-3',5'-bis(diphosphate) 3'-pyrophosphohydrolase [Anaerolineae bacterium]
MKKNRSATDIKNLLERLPDSFNLADRELVQRAYRAANSAHRKQKRISGEPYINHCLAVASILSDLRVPPDVIAAGLLHDVIEDTKVSFDDIKKDFGDVIANLVNGVTKLSNLPSSTHNGKGGNKKLIRSKEELEPSKSQVPWGRSADIVSETLRKTFLAMGDDVRVVIIKLADRLHNMRTLGHLPEEKRERIGKQTLEIYAPLANRLGIWQIKWELEDLAFRYVNPEKYKDIADLLTERRPDRESEVGQIVDELKQLLADSNIEVEISGRPKHIYSIYKKMQRKDNPFDLVRDLRAVRLIVPDLPACYSTLGLIHTHWRPIPGEFDDYIAAPKDNLYQSLHTAVIYSDGKPLEVQIRTPEMHQSAEYGIAAHWKYKEGAPRDEAYDQGITMLRKMMEWRGDVEDAQEFVESMKSDVFQDRVYIFTPRGDIIDLPDGSTPIDFAYHIHTDIGNRCRGARVNQKLVPLDYVLKTGDQVEILSTKRGGPSRDWLNANLGLVNTQRARSKIKAWFRKQDHDQNLASGRSILERELARLGMSQTNLEGLAHDLEYRNTDELHVALGTGDLSVRKIVRNLSEDEVTHDILIAKTPTSEPSSKDAVDVVGLKGLLTNVARCCNPTPGDEIVGYITRGRGATVHRQDCPNVLRIRDRERLVSVSWGEIVSTFSVPIRIHAYDRQGLMGDISNMLNSENINISDVVVKTNENLAEFMLTIDVRDIEQLSRILTRIENLPNVMVAQRTKPG